MADLTLEILTNREKYPDDRKIVLGDGEEVTVKQFRDSLQPRAAFTEASEKWSRRERELTGRQTELEGAVTGLNQQLMEALNKAPASVTRTATGGISPEDLLADPVLGPMYRELQATTANLAKVQKEYGERLEGHERYVLEREYRGKLGDLGSRYNSRFNTDGKGKAFDQAGFLDFCLQRKISDLDVAFDAWSRPDEIAQTTREAEARGEERGKANARVPVVPFGRRRAAVKPEGLPATIQEVTEEQIAADPDIQAAMEADAAG
jgi:hypothetical protein